MNMNFVWILPAGLAMGFGLALAWQRLEMQPLRAELEVLRDRQTETQSLRAERAKLQAQQVPASELERLRADRAAITRMRGEMAAVETAADAKARVRQAKADERFAVGQAMPAAAWRNAGAASPAAALETVLWAAAGGDIDAFARRIQFDSLAGKAAAALLESLPPAERARHPSPAHLLAFLSIKDIPVGSATVSSWINPTMATLQPVSLVLNAHGEKSRQVTLVFERKSEEWKLRATEAAVAKYAAALRGTAVAAGGGK